MTETLSWATGAVSIGWVLYSAFALTRILRMPRLVDEDFELLDELPRLSVIVPACNEEEKLEPAMRSLLALDYPRLQVVIVDDRSTDATPEIVDRLAEDDRVTAVHVTELPEGWLGKVNAMKEGVEAADGEWLLFADADVQYREGALRKILSFATVRELDHIGLIPRIESHGLMHSVLTQVFGLGLVTVIPLHALRRDDVFFGVGAFNLVRREAFERTEGFEWLRMEIADDMALGMMLNRHGARSWGGAGGHSLDIDWYDGAADMLAGMEKNIFAATAHYSVPRALGMIAMLVALATLPFVGLALPAPFGWPPSVAMLAALVPLAAAIAIRWESSFLATLLLPLGLLMMAVGMARSMLAYRRNNGIVWRGTHYPTEELRAEQRVKL